MQTSAFIFLLTCSLAVAWAADPEPVLLDWPAVVATARDHNPELVAARAGVRSAEAAWRASRSEKLPSLSARADGGLSDSASSDDEIDPPPSDSYEIGLSASQLLYDGGRVSAVVAQRRAEWDTARAVLRQREVEVGYDLRKAYAELVYAKAYRDLAAQIQARRTSNLQLVELRFEAGREHKGSYLRSRAALTSATFETDRAERAYAVARRSLARALGVEEAAGWDVTGGLPPVQPVENPDFEALAVYSPLLEQAEARRRVAEAAVKRARSEYLPEAQLSGSLGKRGEDWMPDLDQWSVGVAIELPIFDGARRKQNLLAARADAQQAAEELRLAGYDVVLELESAYAGLRDDVGLSAVRAEFYEAARVRAEIARSQYTSGLLSFEDWDLIENDLIDAERNLLVAKRDAVVSEAAWGLAIGENAFDEE